MTQLFISYNHADSSFVDQLESLIESSFPEITIWRDKSPHGLTGGDNWWTEILKAIAASDIFIYVLSNQSIASSYCRAEFTEARRLRKRIITVQARDTTELTSELTDIQMINMRSGPDDIDSFARLVKAINKQRSLVRFYLFPRWRPATPKPQKDVVMPRAAHAPQVQTEALKPPTIEIESFTLAKNGLRWQIIGVAVTIVLGLLGLAFPLLDHLNGALIASAPTMTSTSTPTSTIDLLELVAGTQTREMEMTLTAMPTATLTPTVTLTPTLTETPTPDIQGTIDAIATGTRAYFQTRDAARMTLEATLATSTPTLDAVANVSSDQESVVSASDGYHPVSAGNWVLDEVAKPVGNLPLIGGIFQFLYNILSSLGWFIQLGCCCIVPIGLIALGLTSSQ